MITLIVTLVAASIIAVVFGFIALITGIVLESLKVFGVMIILIMLDVLGFRLIKRKKKRA